jgi:TolB-like protein
LNNAVKRLRDALEDSAGTPRFIETLPKRGYRFVGSLNGNSVAVSAPEISPTKGNIGSKPSRVLIIGAATAGVLVLGLALALNPAKLRGRSKVPPIRSIAVLPLENLSGDLAQEPFADAMTEELITELSGISALKVISRTSTARYKKTDKPLPEIARQLNVDAIVEGSVVRSADRVRITAQLIYAPQDKNVWARSYEREMKDSLTLQSQVASAIAEEVRAQVAPSEQVNLQTACPVNIKALELYLQGNQHFDRFGTGAGLEEAEKAIQSYRQAIAEDPSFAKAYLKIAVVYDRESDVLPGAKVGPLGEEAAEKSAGFGSQFG